MGSFLVSTWAKVSRRGLWFTTALAVCWYLAAWTELENNTWALLGMIVFLFFLHGLLWPEKVVPLHRRRQRGVQEIIPESGLRRIPEAVIDQPVRKSIASQRTTDTTGKSG
jgi:hypothetical protein